MNNDAFVVKFTQKARNLGWGSGMRHECDDVVEFLRLNKIVAH